MFNVIIRAAAAAVHRTQLFHILQYPTRKKKRNVWLLTKKFFIKKIASSKYQDTRVMESSIIYLFGVNSASAGFPELRTGKADRSDASKAL